MGLRPRARQSTSSAPSRDRRAACILGGTRAAGQYLAVAGAAMPIIIPITIHIGRMTFTAPIHAIAGLICAPAGDHRRADPTMRTQLEARRSAT